MAELKKYSFEINCRDEFLAEIAPLLREEFGKVGTGITNNGNLQIQMMLTDINAATEELHKLFDRYDKKFRSITCVPEEIRQRKFSLKSLIKG